MANVRLTTQQHGAMLCRTVYISYPHEGDVIPVDSSRYRLRHVRRVSDPRFDYTANATYVDGDDPHNFSGRTSA